MMRPIVAGALLVALALSPLGGVVTNPSLATQGTPAAAATPVLEITNIREIELEFEPVSLSPDGVWIAGIRDRTAICLFSLDSEETRCEAVPLDGPILPGSIAWAPDSSAIAFSLDALPTLRNSDIFVLAIDGDLTDLTPDPPGTSATPADDSDESPAFGMDLFPAWSPDGTELVFARHSMADGAATIGRMSRSGGEVERVVDLTTIDLAFVVGPILWLADDSIVYSGAGDAAGIWETSLATGESRQIMPGDDPDLPGAVAVSAAADGSWLSIYSAGNLRRATFDQLVGFVERATGEILLVVGPTGPNRFVNVVPRFDPEGLLSAATYYGHSQLLLIWDITSSHPIASVPLPGEGPGTGSITTGLSWSDANTILVLGPTTSAQIVTVLPGG